MCNEVICHDNQPNDGNNGDVKITVITKRDKNPLYRVKSKFSVEMEEEITSGSRLTCATINHAQLLMHKHFPLLEGFEDTELGALKKMSRFKKERVQTLFGKTEFGADHLCTVYFKSFEQVIVYDSASTGGLDTSFMKQIFEVLSSKENSIKLEGPAVQQQTNVFDCGIFAIAFSVDQCFGKIPSDSNYDVYSMRSHLLDWFKRDKLTPFPLTKKRATKISKKWYVRIVLHL